LLAALELVEVGYQTLSFVVEQHFSFVVAVVVVAAVVVEPVVAAELEGWI